MRSCCKCKEKKDRSEFRCGVNGRYSKQCESCTTTAPLGCRKCRKCGEIKPLSEFLYQGVDKNNCDYYSNCCRVCYRSVQEYADDRRKPKAARTEREKSAPVLANCGRCGKEFNARRPNHKFCCRNRGKAKKVVYTCALPPRLQKTKVGRKKVYDPIPCENCQQLFTPRRSDHKLCCRRSSRKTVQTRVQRDPDYVYKKPKAFVPSVPTYKPYITCSRCWATKKVELVNEEGVCFKCVSILGEDQ